MTDSTSRTGGLRLLVVGAGAIGTYLGVRLANSGNQIVFLERPDPAHHLHENGLELESEGRLAAIRRPKVASSVQAALDLGPFDAAFLAVKSYATPAFLQEIEPFTERFPAVLCLQNGVGNEDLLSRRLGQTNVLAGTVTSAVLRSGIGRAQVARERGIGIAAGHPLSQRLLHALTDAGLTTRLYVDPQGMKWSKLLTNLLGNAGSAITGLSPRQIFAHPGLYQLEIAQFREALEVLRAARIRVVNLPGAPVRLLAFAARWLPAAVSRPILGHTLAGGRGDKMPSLYLDLIQGRNESEVGVLNGAVVDFGRNLGVPTPVNRFYSGTLTQLAQGTLPRETYAGQPDKVLAATRRIRHRSG